MHIYYIIMQFFTEDGLWQVILFNILDSQI
jgi:hypothetical protein